MYQLMIWVLLTGTGQTMDYNLGSYNNLSDCLNEAHIHVEQLSKDANENMSMSIQSSCVKE